MGVAMKLTLVALNASYTHTSLACAYLISYCQDPRWSITKLEFTINDHYDSILSRLYAAESDVYGFSCYIWNIDLVIRLCEDLKMIRPDCFIVLGGPEVSYDAEEMLTKQPHINAIVCGEGEETMYELLQTLAKGQAPSEIPGLVIRYNDELIVGPPRTPIKNLDVIPSPVSYMHNTQGRLVYYETSRGCPFSCSYCLSAREPGVRFFSLERVKSDLEVLIKSGAKVIKFVDRSFNCHERRARQIMEFILEHDTPTQCHFEINAELLSDEMLDFLAGVPKGLFNFEIGVQSTYSPTLKAIRRKTDWPHLRNRIKCLQEMGNFHLHVDLIAGLPHESYYQFAHSFNEVFYLQPDVIQLGFLKMLKGSPLCDQAAHYQYIFQNHSPYEVLSNNVISFAELDRLHMIEEMLVRFYNSRHFKATIEHLTQKTYQGDAFQCFADLAKSWRENNYHLRQHSKEAEYRFLLKFAEHCCPKEHLLIQELLKLDYLSSFPTGRLPYALESFNPEDYSNRLYRFLKDDQFMTLHFPQLAHVSPRQRRRRIHLEWLKLDIAQGNYLPSAVPTFFLYDSSRKELEYIYQPDL
jgi:radical SAM superfamily enzyme YgiQ (UPF0313 family)